MPEEDQTRKFRRHATLRATRLKPSGQEGWIPLSMVNWSAAGASLSGPTENIPLGPAEVLIKAGRNQDEIRLNCDVVWRIEGKVGVRLVRPADR